MLPPTINPKVRVLCRASQAVWSTASHIRSPSCSTTQPVKKKIHAKPLLDAKGKRNSASRARQKTGLLTIEERRYYKEQYVMSGRHSVRLCALAGPVARCV